MKLHTGNMWDIYEEADCFVFTGNSFVKTNGCLVMGRGMARQVLDKFPGIDRRICSKILDECCHLGTYGFVFDEKIGVFQVKYHFKEKADVRLIRYSVKCLVAYTSKYPDKQIHMNYPGIGNGGLPKCVVKPLIVCLPDNVHVWYR